MNYYLILTYSSLIKRLNRFLYLYWSLLFLVLQILHWYPLLTFILGCLMFIYMRCWKLKKLVIWQSYRPQNLFSYGVLWLFLFGSGGGHGIFNTFINKYINLLLYDFWIGVYLQKPCSNSYEYSICDGSFLNEHPNNPLSVPALCFLLVFSPCHRWLRSTMPELC